MLLPVLPFGSALQLARDEMEAAAFFGIEHLVVPHTPPLDVQAELRALGVGLEEEYLQLLQVRRFLSLEGRALSGSLSRPDHLPLLDWASPSSAQLGQQYQNLRERLTSSPSLLRLFVPCGPRPALMSHTS